MFFDISFNDFTTEKKYLELQNRFERNDIPPRDFEEDAFAEIVKEDFSIDYLFPAYPEKDYWTKIFFYKDFLNPKINELAKTSINKIRQKLNSDFQYDKEKSEIFIKKTLDDCYKTENAIKDTTFLNSKIKNNLSTQMKIVLEYLNNDYLKEFQFNDKFQFKLMERDLLVLLALLKNKRKLVNNNESLLGHLIERHFECYDETTQSFKKIQKAGKKLNDFKNNQKTIEKSVARLKTLLQDDSFYEL